jgi:hypothetical protein
MNARLIRFLGAVAVATLLLIPGRAVFAQRMVAPQVTPTEGVPGVRFVFTAPGFQGAGLKDNADNSLGERISYWINLPNGQIISTEIQKGSGADDDAVKPLMTRANGKGEATIYWTAPEDAIAGPYSLVMRGTTSDKEIKLPFTVHPDGWQTEVQKNVTPEVGPAGSSFQFIATGFDDAIDSRDRRGEQVAYWFNTPDGKVIGTEKLGEKNDRGNDTRPLLHYADQDGVVNLVWVAPANLAPGRYSAVFHGLSSQRQVVMYFTIR